MVSHGGLIREMLSYFVYDLDCKIPGDRKHALQVAPNCAVSKFTVSLSEDDQMPKLTCLHIHDKDHLVEANMPVLCMDEKEHAF